MQHIGEVFVLGRTLGGVEDITRPTQLRQALAQVHKVPVLFTAFVFLFLLFLLFIIGIL